jgi:hypothetical protein
MLSSLSPPSVTRRERATKNRQIRVADPLNTKSAGNPYRTPRTPQSTVVPAANPVVTGMDRARMVSRFETRQPATRKTAPGVISTTVRTTIARMSSAGVPI